MVVLGLENAGKTSFVNMLVEGVPKWTVPTVGLNVQQYEKGSKFASD